MSIQTRSRKPQQKQATPLPDEPSPRRRVLRWLAAATLAAVHGLTVPVIGWLTDDQILTMLWLMTPAWITIAFVPVARTSGYHRWLTIIALTVIVDPLWSVPVLVIGHAWAIHRFWWVERDGPLALNPWGAVKKKKVRG